MKSTLGENLKIIVSEVILSALDNEILFLFSEDFKSILGVNSIHSEMIDFQMLLELTLLASFTFSCTS